MSGRGRTGQKKREERPLSSEEQREKETEETLESEPASTRNKSSEFPGLPSASTSVIRENRAEGAPTPKASIFSPSKPVIPNSLFGK